MVKISRRRRRDLTALARFGSNVLLHTLLRLAG
jgi:hypothetical protein